MTFQTIAVTKKHKNQRLHKKRKQNYEETSLHKITRRKTASETTTSEGLQLLTKSGFIFGQNSGTTFRQTRSWSRQFGSDNVRNSSSAKTPNKQKSSETIEEGSSNEVAIFSNKNILKPGDLLKQILIEFLSEESFDEFKLTEALSFLDVTTRKSVEEIIDIVFESCGEDRGLSSKFGKILLFISQIIESRQLNEIDF